MAEDLGEDQGCCGKTGVAMANGCDDGRIGRAVLRYFRQLISGRPGGVHRAIAMMGSIAPAAGREDGVGVGCEGEQGRDQRKAEEKEQDDAESSSHSLIVTERGGTASALEAPTPDEALFRCGFGGLTLDNEVVVDTEGSGGKVGLHSGDGLITLVVDDPVEDYIAIFHDDVNAVESDGRGVSDASSREGNVGARACCLPKAALIGVVFAQRGLGKDAVVDASANAVVIGGVRKDFDLIVDGFDARNAFQGIVDVFLENGARGVAFDDHGFAMEAEGDPVEDTVVGQAG